MPEDNLTIEPFAKRKPGRPRKDAPKVPPEVVRFVAKALLRKEGCKVTIQGLDLFIIPVSQVHGMDGKGGLLLAMETGGCMRWDTEKPLQGSDFFANRFPMSCVSPIMELLVSARQEMEVQHVASSETQAQEKQEHKL